MARQIAAAGQQVCSEGMTQGMRRRAVRQSERASQPGHRQLHDAGRERPAAFSDEQSVHPVETVNGQIAT